MRLHPLLIAAALFSPALVCAAADPPLPGNTKEIGVSGVIYVTHDSPQDLFGVVTGRFGYYVARNNEVGVDATVFAYSRIQDVYLSGFYRYVFARPEHRLAPFVGAGLGANVSYFDYFGSQRSLIAKGEAGLRFFMGRGCALDVAYNFMYRNHTEFGFTGTTSSILTFGFAKMF